ncbi:hypothetical protein J7E91_30465, partial [Streptomyces sp. ISL-99]|uniref:hypothetical protein n=1 Tax=Streptomyces sp. ISL-99 TaxID=2819193 RepID=UPI001BEAF0DF
VRYFVFPTLSDSFVSDFLGAFQFFAFAFPFPAIPTLSGPFGPDSQSAGLSFRLFGRSDALNSSGFPERLIIEPVE